MVGAEQSQVGPTHVAPLLPPTADPPLPPRRVGFFKGFLLFWLLPRRYGPHLAMRSIWLALAAHALVLVLVAVIVAAVLLITSALPVDLTWQNWRVGCAWLVLGLASAGTAMPFAGWEIAIALATIPMTQVAVVALGVLLMPWCADGDGAKSVFRRSVKNVYWTTTAAVPFVLAWAGTYLFLESRKTWMRGTMELTVMMLVLLALLAAGGLVLRALLVGASRYAGEPDGPAFRPREPLCEQCGYLIVALPLTSPCPECGLAVSESLPGGRRRPTDWQRSELSSAGFRDLLRTQWRVLSEPAFFQRLPVQNGLRAARHFWWGTFLLILLAALVVVRGLLFLSYARYSELFPLMTTLTIGLPIGMQMLMMFGACLWAQVALGIRDYRVAATACYYASPLMWPLVAALLLMGSFAALADLDYLSWAYLNVTLLGVRLRMSAWVLIGLAVVAAGCVIFWWRRLARALRDVRYANV